ncbi:hypothetical protein D3C71_1181020 [compost metagenome]
MSSPHIHLLCRNLYDPLDRLIGQTHPDIAAHQRFYCNSRLTTEIQGALHYSFVQHEDHLLAQKHYLDNKHDATLLATDLQRSVLQALEASHQRRPIAYTPYGHRIAESGLSSLLGFNGERPDPVTGHYLLGNGYRAFNPVLMCFNSPDNLSPFGKGGLNSYAYCSRDPVNFVDSTGHMLKGVLTNVAGAVKTVERNIPVRNSLEGMDFDGFHSLSKYLDKSDMDSLAKTSVQLNKLSTETSVSNLKAHLSSVGRQGLRLDKRMDLDGWVMTPAGNHIPMVAPKGIGSIGWKSLAPSVEGGVSLGGKVVRTRQLAVDQVMPGTFPKESRRAINRQHIAILLREMK